MQVLFALFLFVAGLALGGYAAIRVVVHAFINTGGAWGAYLRKIIVARKEKFGARCLDDDFRGGVP